MKTNYFLLLLILLYSANILGQGNQKVALSGVVSSLDGTPVPYATIVAKEANSTGLSGAISDEYGRFTMSLSFLPDSIAIRCLGFEEIRMSAEKLVDTIFLSPQSSGLNEVVVQGNMPTIQLQGSALQVNIQGTVLANESSIIDVLRKTPGLIANDGNITTIEGYTPSYYLNGRKVSSLSEIKNLDVKSIMSVALDTSPGARYSSSEKAVVNIRTTTPLDGLSLVGQSYSRVNKRFTHDNSLDFSAKMKSVRLFGGLSYSDYRRNNTQDASIVMNTRGTQIHTMLDDIFSSEKEILYHAGAEYSKNERFWAGIKYNGSHNHTSSRTKSETKAVLSGETDLVSGDNRVEDNTERHHLNAYIGRKWHEKFSSDLFLDFYTTEGDRKQSVIEQSSLMGNTDAIFNNQSAYTMLSAKPVFGYTLSSYLSSEFGGDYLYVSGESDQKKQRCKSICL